MINDKAIEYPIPDELIIKYPKWLHKDICDTVQEHIGRIVYYKHAPLGVELGIYGTLANCFNRIKLALITPIMKPIWCDLYKENPEKTLMLFFCLLQIENDFDHGLGLRVKHENEIKSTQKIPGLAQKLIDTMEENYRYYGHMQTENFGVIFELLIAFKKDTEKLINGFRESIKEKDYLFCDHWPIGRKHNAENSLAIFFIRKLYQFFATEFGSPKYSAIETIVNVIFGTEYTENHVIKYTTTMRKLACDDSLEK